MFVMKNHPYLVGNYINENMIIILGRYLDKYHIIYFSNAKTS